MCTFATSGQATVHNQNVKEQIWKDFDNIVKYDFGPESASFTEPTKEEMECTASIGRSFPQFALPRAKVDTPIRKQHQQDVRFLSNHELRGPT